MQRLQWYITKLLLIRTISALMTGKPPDVCRFVTFFIYQRIILRFIRVCMFLAMACHRWLRLADEGNLTIGILLDGFVRWSRKDRSQLLEINTVRNVLTKWKFLYLEITWELDGSQELRLRPADGLRVILIFNVWLERLVHVNHFRLDDGHLENLLTWGTFIWGKLEHSFDDLH